jgi:hypothetical protein
VNGGGLTSPSDKDRLARTTSAAGLPRCCRVLVGLLLFVCAWVLLTALAGAANADPRPTPDNDSSSPASDDRSADTRASSGQMSAQDTPPSRGNAPSSDATDDRPATPKSDAVAVPSLPTEQPPAASGTHGPGTEASGSNASPADAAGQTVPVPDRQTTPPTAEPTQSVEHETPPAAGWESAAPVDAPSADIPQVNRPPIDPWPGRPPTDPPEPGTLPVNSPPTNAPASSLPPADASTADAPPVDTPQVDVPPTDAPTDAPPISLPPVNAPPIGPTAAGTSATGSALGSRFDEHPDTEIAMLAAHDAVVLADASARTAARVPGVVGGVDDPRGHPD